MRAKRVAPSAEPTNDSAAEEASAASFQPRNAHTRAGALSPSGRLSQINGCIRITVHHAPVGSLRLEEALRAPTGDRNDGSTTVVATLRPGDEVDAVLACT